jgi:hypothetical protein
MEIKQLKELLKLLRAQGVQQYATPELTLVLGEAPVVIKRQASDVDLEEETLTPEEEAERMLFYSATPPTASEDN